MITESHTPRSLPFLISLHLSQTEYIEQTLEPVWNESMRIGSQILTDTDVTAIRILMYDKDAFSNDFMGALEIPIARFKTNFDEWFPLTTKSGKKDKSLGTIHLRCSSGAGKSSNNPFEEAHKKINEGTRMDTWMIQWGCDMR